MTAEEYFEMATANTIETRPQVCAEECIMLMNDYAETKAVVGLQKIVEGILLNAWQVVHVCRERKSEKMIESAIRYLERKLIKYDEAQGLQL